MATLHPEVDRLRRGRDRLVRLRTKMEMGERAPEAVPRHRDWVAREVLAHIDEMLPYCLGEIERVLASPVEPAPFGRTSSDAIRTLTVDRDRTLPVAELYARLDSGLERVVRRLLELDDRQLLRKGIHRQRGLMTVQQIADVLLAGHLEEHCTQLTAALEPVVTVTPAS